MKYFKTKDYHLELTLNSGQAFRWQASQGGWEGVIHRRWVRLVPRAGGVGVETVDPPSDWDWLIEYLQLHCNLEAILAKLPRDPPMTQAIAQCRGLHLLRQEPWECLASFILSSTKAIPHIRELITALARRFGEPVKVPSGRPPFYSFPAPDRLARSSESELRGLKLGFRAPYLLEAARRVASGRIQLDSLGELPLETARTQLTTLPGIGAKIADCVLLFAYGFMDAFPVDVWITKALHENYFPKNRPTPRELHTFIDRHFPLYRGYAQQYLFQYQRTRDGRT